MYKIRPFVFLVPFSLLLLSAAASIFKPKQFLEIAKGANDWIISTMDWLFSYSTFGFLLVLAATYVLPIANVRIGGEGATPMLNRWQWFSITLCTTIATGILFWGTAEPMYHAYTQLEGIEDKNAFALSTLFMHWTITPYGIYTLGGLVFAISFYNLKQPFSVSAMLFPLLGNRAYGIIGQLTDAICLFALVAGMAASLGTGILSLAGGLGEFVGLLQGKKLYGMIGAVMVVVFVISSASGLKKGIRILSGINIQVFIGLALFMFIVGPTREILELSAKGGVDFVKNFIPRSLGLDPLLKPEWVQSWTVFYWANWLAWTPVTALFLGRIARGYTVREFIHFNLLLPAIFGGCWMGIFGGTTLALDAATQGAMHNALEAQGPQSIIYSVLAQFPLSEVLSGLMLFAIFISYVTAADSNTSAMTGMSVTGVSSEAQEAPLGMKALWGCLVGLVSWVMISYAGIDGIKMISNLGGFPALFLLILVSGGLIKLIYKLR